MKKFIPAITLVTLLSIQVPAQAAWRSKTAPPTKEAKPTTGFNLKDNRSGFVEADYLLWRPQMENSSFSVKSNSNLLTAGSAGAPETKAKIKQPSFDLSSGVRVGIGGYSFDSWDISLRGTYFYSDAHKHVHADSTAGSVVNPNWYGSATGVNGTKASDRWQLNFGLLDFALGREYFLTKRFAVHPTIGLRGAFINQTNYAKYTATFVDGVLGVIEINTKFSAKSTIRGVGPRAGLDLNFYVSKEWSFLGGVAGSLLYTHYSVRETLRGQLPITSTLNSTNLRVKESDHFGRANLDAYFGIGWDHWYNNGKNRVAIAVAFEAQQWFNLNQWFTLDLITGATTNLRTTKNNGDLSLVGGTLHFQIDF